MGRKDPSKLTEKLYVYIEPENSKFVQGHGANAFGSQSAYINALISFDRDQPLVLGKWRSKIHGCHERETVQDG